MPEEAIEVIRLSVALIRRKSVALIRRSPHSFAMLGLQLHVVVGDVLEVQVVMFIS